MPIPATDAAMTNVAAAQPTIFRKADTGNFPMIFGLAVMIIMIAITGTATIPLITALQKSALTTKIRGTAASLQWMTTNSVKSFAKVV